MASIRKRGNSYLLVVSMGYDPEGHRRKPQQKTVHPPEGLTPKAKEKWLEEEAALFERECKNQPFTVDKSIYDRFRQLAVGGIQLGPDFKIPYLMIIFIVAVIILVVK